MYIFFLVWDPLRSEPDTCICCIPEVISGSRMKVRPGKRTVNKGNHYKGVTKLGSSAVDWSLTFFPWSVMKCDLELFDKRKKEKVFIHLQPSPD